MNAIYIVKKICIKICTNGKKCTKNVGKEIEMEIEKKIIFTFRKVALLTESRRIMSLLREVEILLLFMDATESESRSLSSLNTLLLLLLPTIFK